MWQKDDDVIIFFTTMFEWCLSQNSCHSAEKLNVTEGLAKDKV